MLVPFDDPVDLFVGEVIEDRSCSEIADSDIVVTDGSDTKKNAAASIVVMVRIG